MRTTMKPKPALQSGKEALEAGAGIIRSGFQLFGGFCNLGVDIVEGWQDTNREERKTDLVEAITVNSITRSQLLDDAFDVIENRYESLDKVDTTTLSPRQKALHEARLSTWDTTMTSVVSAPKR